MANVSSTEGIKSFLNLLEDDDVKKLTATVTQNLVKQEDVKTKEDAIDIILRHSPDIPSILNRKLIRREFLFQYLNDKGLSLVPPLTKLTLINKVINFWNGTGNCNDVPKYTTENNIQVATIPSEVDDVNLLATKFAEWFYCILNENEPIGEEHFWQDSSLKLNMISESATVSDCVENNPTELVNLLFKTKCEHALYFNPNLTSEGIKGKMDCHGLVMVFVCGTLHTKETCVGIYEQMFGLARDPYSDNNWKIKHTLLNLRSKPVTNVPILADSSLTSDLLSISEN